MGAKTTTKMLTLWCDTLVAVAFAPNNICVCVSLKYDFFHRNKKCKINLMSFSYSKKSMYNSIYSV